MISLEKLRVQPRQLFNLIFWNTFFAQLVIFLIVGFLSLIGEQPVSFNNEPRFGIVGFLSAMLMFPLISIATSVSIWILLMFGNLVIRFLIFLRKK